MLDYYNHTVVYNSEGSILLTASTISSLNECGNNDNQGLKGETKVITSKGVAIFDGLNVICNPKGNMTIIFTGELSGSSVSVSLEVLFDECSSGEKLEGGRCVECGLGTYSLFYEGSNTKCHEGCPEGSVRCSGSTINVSSGWWRAGELSSTVFECPYGSNSCLGGEKTGDDSCEVGYEGPLCAVCSSGYYFQSVDSTCKECPNGPNVSLFSLIVIVVLGLLIGLICMYFILSRFDVIDLITDFSIIGCVTQLWHNSKLTKVDWENVELKAFVNRMSCKTKIYVTLYQIISSLPFVLQFSFPDTYTKINSFGSIVNLNFFNDIALSCDYNYDYIDFLIMVTVIPAGLTCLLVSIYYYHYSYLRWYRSKSKSAESSLRVYLKIFLVGSFLALPGISIFIFRTFSCIDLDPDNEGGEYLQADYSISCESFRYEWGRAYAIGMVFVYPVGVTVYYYWLLYNHRELIKNRKSASLSELDHKLIEPLEFLFSAYEPRYWYWEVIETIRRVLLTGVLVIFHQGSGLQIVAAFVISLVFLKLYGYYGK